MFPVQCERIEVDEEIQRAAYEVYEHVFSPQRSLLKPETCRGGFGTHELLAFLWTRQFPREEWKKRFDEAFAKIKSKKQY
jgi:hypothetical protein